MTTTLDGSVLFGGSFDPIHIGHEYITELLHSTLGYERVYLIPAQKNRIRHSMPIASFKHRVQMCRLVAQQCSAVHVIKHAHTYARCQTIYDTLLLLKRHHTWSGRIHIAIGDDLISELEHWHHFNIIKSQLKFIILRRDTNVATIDRQLSQLDVLYQTVENALQPMRSSSLRMMLEKGESTQRWISQPIYTYITSKRLYNVSVNYPKQTVRYIKQRLKYEVSARRRRHIRNVAWLIGVINDTVRYDAQQVTLAALTHDWAREWPYSHLKASVTAHRPLDEFESENPILCHGFVASKLLQSVVPSTDLQVLEAVAHHTLGLDNQSNLVLSMLYAADYLELGRKLFSKKQTKRLVKIPIHHLVAFVIEHIRQRGYQLSATTHAWHRSIVNSMYNNRQLGANIAKKTC